MDDDIEVRIYGGVWICLDERDADGNWNVQYVRGEPDENKQMFRKALSMADGMLSVPAETDVQEVRASPSA